MFIEAAEFAVPGRVTERLSAEIESTLLERHEAGAREETLARWFKDGSTWS